MHKLKVWPEFYEQVINGNKPFEVRKDDRGFKVGDWVTLNEYDAKRARYTGRGITLTISYILSGGHFGIEKGYCVLGLRGDV